MTMKACFRYFCDQLKGSYSDREARQIAHMVFEKVTGATRLDLITKGDTAVPAGQRTALDKKLRQLGDEVPVQYVLGEAWFYHRRFHVSEHVLIPRPETEELVAWITEDLRGAHAIAGKRSPGTFSILDIGTGSGCIAIALKKDFPDAVVFATDQSREALDVAGKNAAMHGTAIRFMQSDILDQGSHAGFPSFDLIVSNPPYIPSAEKSGMQPQVVRHEPSAALFVPDHDPLLFYKAILQLADRKLADNGKVYTEIHEDFGPAVQELFRQRGFEEVTLRQDINGRDRMIRGTKG